MLTGAAQGLRSLVVIRFLFGAGEAGAFPNAVRSFATWFPARERGMANGVLFFGSRLGGALTAPLALVLVRAWGWRLALRGVRRRRRRVGADLVSPVSRPARGASGRGRRRAGVDSAGRRRHGGATAGTGPTPWAALLTSPNFYAICAMYFAFGYGLYFYFTWLPTYLRERAGLLGDRRRRLLVAALRARRRGEPGRRLDHRSTRAHRRLAARALDARRRVVLAPAPC